MVADDDAWHKLGTVVQGAQTAEETMIQANTGWTCSKRPLYDENGRELPIWGIFRDDTNAFFGGVKAGYTIIQNPFKFKFVDSLMEADGRAHYVAAGAIGQGERVWCQADLNYTTEPIAGDVSKNYITFVNSHDGSMSAKAFVTQTRIVCQNTMNLALNGIDFALNVRHTKNAEERINQARTLFSDARQTAETINEKLRILAKRRLTKESYNDLVARTFYAGKTTEEAEKDTRTQNVLEEILKLYDYNDNNAFPEIRGTAYNFFQALTNHTDHHRNVRQTTAKKGWSIDEIRADNALFGTGAQLKQQVFEVLLDRAHTMPEIQPTAYSIPSYATTTANAGLLDSILAAHN